MSKLEEVMNASVSSAVNSVSPEITKYILNSGGKRLRSLILFYIARKINSNKEECIKLASAIEMMHTATLLHDDVIDEAEYRRNRKNAKAIWGNKLNILTGDYLFTRAFSLFLNVKAANNAIRYMNDSISNMVDAEILQLKNSYDLSISEKHYFNIIKGKTASLFVLSFILPGILIGLENSKIQLLEKIGVNFGICFQIYDDIMDYFLSMEKLGKKEASDFMEGKITLPIIYLYKNAKENDKKKLEEIFSRKLFTKDSVNYVITMIKQDSILEVVDTFRKYSNKFKKDISKIIDDPSKIIDILLEMEKNILFYSN